MRNIKEIFRLKFVCGLSERKIAASCGVSRRSVALYFHRAKAAGIDWAGVQSAGDAELEALLFPPATPAQVRPLPDWSKIDQELRDHKKLNLTLMQLWMEHKQQFPDGYSYSQFCEHYRRWRKGLDYCMRQEHKGGDKLFIDYADGLNLVDSNNGELIPTQLFVAVWGASNYTYAEASLSQSLPSWISSHARALEYFGCAPRLLVPDNLKSAVSRACFYEPEINPTYADFARHYGSAVFPARPRHPRDKAKAEGGVLIAKRWILSVLRHRVFHNPREMNVAIAELLERLNSRPLRKRKQSRRQLFEQLDLPAAIALPAQAYEFAEWKRVAANIDYHIEVDRHYYSVPFRLRREKLDVRLTASTVEVFLNGERVAVHARSYQPHAHTTLKDHMPGDHRKYAEWTPSRILQWAAQNGPATASLIESVLASRAFPEQAYRSCLGILRLGRHYGKERLEAAALRATQFHACSYKSVRSILAKSLDRSTETPAHPTQIALPLHENIRGGDYFN